MGASEARQLLCDLVVASVELCARPMPEHQRSVTQSFDDWYAFARSWMHLVIDCGIAVRADPTEVSPDLLAALAEPFRTCSVLGGLCACVARRFTYIGTFDGDLYGAIDWEKLSIVRSAIELVRDLLDGEVWLSDQLDTFSIERDMARWGLELAKTLPVPERMPPHHWWWFHDRPPGEHTLRMNRRMTELSSGDAEVPMEFRRFVEEGFVMVEGCLFFRRLAPFLLSTGNDIGAECRTNSLHLEDYFDGDDRSRLNLADTALASARWVASELRRRDAPPCRIIASVRADDRTSVLRFHVIRPDDMQWIGDNLERYREEGVLVLDTA